MNKNQIKLQRGLKICIRNLEEPKRTENRKNKQIKMTMKILKKISKKRNLNLNQSLKRRRIRMKMKMINLKFRKRKMINTSPPMSKDIKWA